jgi:hypothetical protein
VKAEQELDVICRKVKEGLSQRQDYVVDEDRLLYRKDAEGTPRLVIPETMMGRLIHVRDHHDESMQLKLQSKRSSNGCEENIIGLTYTGTSKIMS